MIKYTDYQPKKTSRVREDIEWTIAYSYDTSVKDKPRVLLIGDSICHQYHGKVREFLADKCLVSYWASSKCVTDPDYFRELDFYLDAREYDVISFNNGLHSLDTDREEWEEAYRAAIAFIKAKKPNAKLLLTLSTALRDLSQTEISYTLNEIVKKIAAENCLEIIDLYAPSDKKRAENCWSDGIHFKNEAIEEQGRIIASKILQYIQETT